MLCRVITQIKGIFGKSPKINIKHGYNIIYFAHMWEYVSTNYKFHACITGPYVGLTGRAPGDMGISNGPTE
jgi:hypothetical protein